MVTVAERVPLVLLAQKPELSGTSHEGLVAAARPVFLRYTAFEVIAPAAAGVDPRALENCTVDVIACWYRALAAERAAPNILLLGFEPIEPKTGEVRVVATYIDGNQAPDLAKFPNSEELQGELVSHAKSIGPTFVVKGSPQALEKYFVGLAQTGLRDALEANQRTRVLGNVMLQAPPRVLAIEIDGAKRSARGPLVRLEGVEPGARALTVRDASDGVVLQQMMVEVRAGAEATVVVPANKTDYEKVVFWGGAGAIAVGSAITVVALTTSNDPTVIGCAMPGCTEPEFRSFCGRTEGCSFLGATRIAPLGYSLILTGVVWLVGEMFTSEDYVLLPLIAGVLGGGAAYGVSVAID